VSGPFNVHDVQKGCNSQLNRVAFTLRRRCEDTRGQFHLRGRRSLDLGRMIIASSSADLISLISSGRNSISCSLQRHSPSGHIETSATIQTTSRAAISLMQIKFAGECYCM